MKNRIRRVAGRVGVLELGGLLVGADDRATLERHLQRARERGIRHLLLDLRGATMVNGAGIGILLFARKIWTRTGGDVRVVGPCDRARSLIRVSRLGSLLPWHRSVAEAVAAVRAEENRPPRPAALFGLRRAARSRVSGHTEPPRSAAAG